MYPLRAVEKTHRQYSATIDLPQVARHPGLPSRAAETSWGAATYPWSARASTGAEGGETGYERAKAETLAKQDLKQGPAGRQRRNSGAAAGGLAAKSCPGSQSQQAIAAALKEPRGSDSQACTVQSRLVQPATISATSIITIGGKLVHHVVLLYTSIFILKKVDIKVCPF